LLIHACIVGVSGALICLAGRGVLAVKTSRFSF
jgi:hypothetical protein